MIRALICAFLVNYACAQPEKVVFDTDCAYFNDDGAALVMLLNRPKQVEIEGMTVVPGNFWPIQGAEYMSHILKLMGRSDVPLFFGAQAPLVHTRAMVKKETGIEYLGAFKTDPPKFSGSVKAIDFLIETIEKSPGKITVLGLGPMTNLAIALRMRPDLQSKIGRLVFMGGATHGQEFNFWFDPEAAQIVLRSSIQKKVMFGLDICERVPIDKAHSDQITAHTPIADLYRDDRAKNPSPYVWDALPAAFLLDTEFVTRRETRYLDVDSVFGKNYGAVIPLDRTLAPDATPVEVMLDLDFERFFALYKSLIH
jgi:inosine-uridine nucleoside N-ribohydrolase